MKKAAATKNDTKKIAIVFGNIWRVAYKGQKQFLTALKKLDPNFDPDNAVQQYIEEGEVRRILDVTVHDISAIKALLRNVPIDVENLYRKALVAYELDRLPESDIKAVREIVKPATVKGWADQEAMPSHATLIKLHANLDIDLLKRSVLDHVEKDTTPKSFPPLTEADKKNAPVGGGKSAVEEKPVKPVKATKATGRKFHFGDVWSEHHAHIDAYMATTFNRDESLIYSEVADGELSSLLEVTPAMLEAMQDKHPKQDITLMYRRALFQYHYVNLPFEKRAQLDDIFGVAAVRKWVAQVGSVMPTVAMLEEMYNRGFYMVARSVAEEDNGVFGNKKSVEKISMAEGDEILDMFTQRDLDRVTHLAHDFAKITDEGNNGVSYMELTTAPAFRAMMELWPSTFRHDYESTIDLDADEPNEWWQLETRDFKARVTDNRAEVYVEHDAGGYTMYTNTDSLAGSVFAVLGYFDVIPSEQLGIILTDSLGFENDHVAGVEFDLCNKTEFTPQSFFDRHFMNNEIIIRGNNQHLNAATFLLLASQTTRGVVVRPISGAEEARYKAFELNVGATPLNVLCLGTADPVDGPVKGAASLTEHADDLSETFKEVAHMHGVYFNDRNELELPVSHEAREMFHRNNADAQGFMEMVVFI